MKTKIDKIVSAADRLIEKTAGSANELTALKTAGSILESVWIDLEKTGNEAEKILSDVVSKIIGLQSDIETAWMKIGARVENLEEKKKKEAETKKARRGAKRIRN